MGPQLWCGTQVACLGFGISRLLVEHHLFPAPVSGWCSLQVDPDIISGVLLCKSPVLSVTSLAHSDGLKVCFHELGKVIG